MGESGKRVKPVSTKFSQQTLCSSDRTSDRSWDSHTIVVLCMTKTCRCTGEHCSDPFGIPSRHEQRSTKRCPAPELVAIWWASVGIPILCCRTVHSSVLVEVSRKYLPTYLHLRDMCLLRLWNLFSLDKATSAWQSSYIKVGLFCRISSSMHTLQR